MASFFFIMNYINLLFTFLLQEVIIRFFQPLTGVAGTNSCNIMIISGGGCPGEFRSIYGVDAWI